MNKEKIFFDILKQFGCKGILITDGNGKVIMIEEEFFQKEWGLSEDELIGKTAAELEKTGAIKPVLAIDVMETHDRVTRVSAIKGLHNIVGEAFPIFDDQHNIEFIVSFTRDIISEHKVIKLYDEIIEKYIKSDYESDNSVEQWISQEGMISFNYNYAKAIEEIEKVAHYDVTVLITGDTGTGKSRMARRIHQISGAKGEFVEVNCGAISPSLFESELFGYDKGSFTGAEKNGKKGLIETAMNGTLFLDEISEMPLNLQVKLLDFLQEKRIRRVGSPKSIPVNCRVVAATNKNLKEEVQEGNFREDLFYRLSLASFEIPPLNERYEDIIPLAKSILRFIGTKYEREMVFDYEVLSLFMDYPWPGNVRELENTIHRMVIMSDSNVLRKDLLPTHFFTNIENKPKNNISVFHRLKIEGRSLKNLMEDYEKQIILEAVNKYRTSTKVGEMLGIGQTTAARKIRKYMK